MARTKPKSKTEPAAPQPAGLTEGLMEMLMDQLARSRTSETVDAAQDLMFEAWETDAPRKRVALAREALKVSADCADAYVLLAQEAAATPQEALALLSEGVAAGARALGEAAFVEDVGEFWGLLETRPYMRARLALAMAQWQAGRGDEAAGHAADMLRLNPSDSQGIRYLLLNWLLTLGRGDETAALLRRYRDPGDPQWAWPAALAAFRRKGDNAASRKALDVAVAANGHVAAYLTGRRKLPKALPPYYSPGDRDEAVIYVSEGAGAWAATPGATAWVQERTEGATRTSRPSS